MAAEDRLLRNEEINYGTDGNMQLVRYKDYEPYDGIKQSFSYTWPVVYYSDSTYNITTAPISQTGPQSCPGVAISNYTLGSSSPSTPKRYQLMAQKYYDSNFTIYYVSLHNPGDKPEPYTYCQDASGNLINFKYKAWIGWAHMYNSSWTNVQTNPLFSASTLAAVKNTLSNQTPYNLVDAYSFGYFYQRYSQNYISGLTFDNGSSASSHWMQALVGYFVVNGCTKTITKTTYKGDGYANPDGYSSYMNWIIPGDYYDTTDSDTYWIYGYLATSKKLYPYSYITLSNYYHTTHLMVTYVGDDADYINSGGQTYNSASGFLNLGSNTQDKNDRLRHIYKFSSQFSTGFINTLDNCLILSGVANNIVYITCGCRVSCAASGTNYTINFRYSFQVLDNNNHIIQTTSKFVHSVNVGSVTGYQNIFYDASTVVVEEYPTYYKIKVTQIEWSRDNTSYNNYINCSLVKSIITSNGRQEFQLIIYDPPIMQNPY